MTTKTCYKCHEEKELSQFGKDGSNSDGFRYDCKSCQKAYREENREKISAQRAAYQAENREKLRAKGAVYREENRERIRARQSSTPRGRYTRYKSSAKTRGLSFDLTFDQFMSFWQMNCSYCGGAISTIGLDRIDSDKGYELDNIVPCCTMCNSMKLDYSEGEWLDKMLTILKHKGIV